MITRKIKCGKKEEIISYRGAVKVFIDQNAKDIKESHWNWNGYGYADHEYIYILTPKKYDSLLDIIKGKTTQKKEKKNEDSNKKIITWAKRLAKLTGLSLEEAIKIAFEKIEYKKEELQLLEERQSEKYSIQRDKLIRKKERENPLRRIEDSFHADAILTASKRHKNTNYEHLLKEGRELVKMGVIDNAKEYARKNYKG